MINTLRTCHPDSSRASAHPALPTRSPDGRLPARACSRAGWRVIATPRGAALLAGAQVHPLRTDLHALLALPPLRVPDGRNRGDMGASCVGHALKLLLEYLMDEGHGHGVA